MNSIKAWAIGLFAFASTTAAIAQNQNIQASDEGKNSGGTGKPNEPIEEVVAGKDCVKLLNEQYPDAKRNFERYRLIKDYAIEKGDGDVPLNLPIEGVTAGMAVFQQLNKDGSRFELTNEFKDKFGGTVLAHMWDPEQKMGCQYTPSPAKVKNAGELRK